MSKQKFQISCKAEDNKAVIRIDGYISSWNNHAAGFKLQLDQIIANGINDAVIYINSGGGDCFQANEIANELIRFTGSKVAKLGALCASAATYIACKCDTVEAAENTSYMIHKPMTDIIGNSDQVKADLKLLENMEANYAKAYTKKTGLSDQKIKELWVTDYWMNSEEAKKLGFIDSIEGEADVTEEDIQAVSAYKNAPKLSASIKNSNQNNIMKQLIITAFALSATLTDAQVMAHLEEVKGKAAKADDLEKEVVKLKAEGNKIKKDAVLDDAIAKKKITDAQRAFWDKSLDADFEGTKAQLESMAGVTKLSTETANTSASSVDRSKWTYADYQEKDPKALQELAEKNESEFNRLFEAHYGTK